MGKREKKQLKGGVNSDLIEEGGGGGDQVLRLLEECLSHIMALTSPRDACRSEAVSIAFRSAALSNIVWKRFLPHDILEILERAISRIEYSSMKHLYLQLCDPIVIDGGKKSFWLDRETGSKCYMLSARDLVITGGDSPQHWAWNAHPESSFPEVAELLNIRWLEIHGKIGTSDLSPRTQYAAYIVFKATMSFISYPYQEASVCLGAYVSKSSVGLRQAAGVRSCIPGPIPNHRRQEFLEAHLHPGDRAVDARVPRRQAVAWPFKREDGWAEEMLGEFYTEDGDAGEVDICLKEVEGKRKSGLVVQGIEIRPSK